MGSKAGTKGGTTGGGVRGNGGNRGTPPSATVAGCPPPIEVVHAFGSCPDRVRDNMCLLGDQRVAYAVGSRVAVTDVEGGGVGGSGALTFLSTGLRVSRVSAVACSADKRFVTMCFKAVDEPHTAYATVYHMPTQPRPSRVKTLSYERPRRQQQQQQQQQEDASEGSRCAPDLNSSGTGVTSRSSKRWAPAAVAAVTGATSVTTAEFVTANFSHDDRILALLDGGPEWTLLWFEWKTGKKMCTLELGSPVHRVVSSPLDQSKTATAGANGLFRIWRTHAGGKVAPMAPIAGLREVSERNEKRTRQLEGLYRTAVFTVSTVIHKVCMAKESDTNFRKNISSAVQYRRVRPNYHCSPHSALTLCTRIADSGGECGRRSTVLYHRRGKNQRHAYLAHACRKR